MPSWGSLFTKNRSSRLSIEVRPAKSKFRKRESGESLTGSNAISTLSSIDEIVRSVSEANTSGPSSDKALASTYSSSTDSTDVIKSMAIRSCMCCSTKLEIPDDVTYFKCGVCDTLHTIDVRIPSEFVVPQIDFERIEDMVTMAVSTEDFSELETLFGNLFSSIWVANRLFLLRSDKPHKTSYSRPNLDYNGLNRFYTIIHETAGSEQPIRILMNIMLNLLRNPKMNFNAPNDLCFLLICLELPVLYGGSIFASKSSRDEDSSRDKLPSIPTMAIEIIERVSGLIVCSSNECRHYLLNWIIRLPVDQYQPKVELINACISHRLIYHHQSRYGRKKRSHRSNTVSIAEIHASSTNEERTARTDGETSRASETSRQSSQASQTCQIASSSSRPPSIAARRGPGFDKARRRSFHTSSVTASLNLGSSSRQKKKPQKNLIKREMYGCDWKIKMPVRFMAILFHANTSSKHQIPISVFYNTMVDFTDVIHDFDDWQRATSGSIDTGTALTGPKLRKSMTGSADKRKTIKNLSDSIYRAAIGDDIIDSANYTVSGNGSNSFYSHLTLLTNSGTSPTQFFFCQYPFLLSMGSKTEILEHDALIQMEMEAQAAFFGSLLNKQHISPYLHIQIHRDKLLQESLAAFEKNEENYRKSIRVEFIGEPGVDAGGLKKEWFSLLIKELFDHKAGYFYEESDSNYYWFGNRQDKSLRYYKLSGIAIGLALYNSTILDVRLPPVTFKKLLGSAYTLEDFIGLKPTHGQNLKKMLEYQHDDFEDVFSLNFVVYNRDELTNKTTVIELVPGGESIMVTKDNRQEYVRRTITHFLDTNVRKQFEAFKQGFCTVVEGNALSLFRPEEIELLVCGSPEPIDVDALRSVTKYQHWGSSGYEPNDDHVVKWFWEFFKRLSDKDQRKLLIFITGSDRIPATGITNMPFRISRLGDNCDRLPTAHTCFNQLCLYAYSSREKLESKMTTAMNESLGFGIK